MLNAVVNLVEVLSTEVSGAGEELIGEATKFSSVTA